MKTNKIGAAVILVLTLAAFYLPVLTQAFADFIPDPTQPPQPTIPILIPVTTTVSFSGSHCTLVDLSTLTSMTNVITQVSVTNAIGQTAAIDLSKYGKGIVVMSGYENDYSFSVSVTQSTKTLNSTSTILTAKATQQRNSSYDLSRTVTLYDSVTGAKIIYGSSSRTKTVTTATDPDTSPFHDQTYTQTTLKGAITIQRWDPTTGIQSMDQVEHSIDVERNYTYMEGEYAYIYNGSSRNYDRAGKSLEEQLMYELDFTYRMVNNMDRDVSYSDHALIHPLAADAHTFDPFAASALKPSSFLSSVSATTLFASGFIPPRVELVNPILNMYFVGSVKKAMPALIYIDASNSQSGGNAVLITQDSWNVRTEQWSMYSAEDKPSTISIGGGDILVIGSMGENPTGILGYYKSDLTAHWTPGSSPGTRNSLAQDQWIKNVQRDDYSVTGLVNDNGRMYYPVTQLAGYQEYSWFGAGPTIAWSTAPLLKQDIKDKTFSNGQLTRAHRKFFDGTVTREAYASWDIFNNKLATVKASENQIVVFNYSVTSNPPPTPTETQTAESFVSWIIEGSALWPLSLPPTPSSIF